MLRKLLLSVQFALLTVAIAAHAQTPTTLIVPFPAGGGLDGLGRIVGQTLQQQGAGTYVVDNKPGANGMIGAKAGAAARPDGTTWLVIDGAVFTVNPFLYPKDPSFEAERDLKVVRAIGFQPSILVVNPASGLNTVKEFVEAARKAPVTYASGGIGSAGHLTMESFGKAAGLQLNHVPYKGGAPAMNDLLGGQVQAAFVALPNALPHVKTGKLVALAVSGKQRSSQLPSVPTVIESGYPGFEVETGYFVMLPSKVPADVTDGIERKVAAALADSATQERIRGIGIEPAGMDRAAAQQWLARDKVKWEKLIRENGIKVE